MKKTCKAFTLVELIVVMAIIGVLAAILVPSMMTFVKNAKVSSANSTASSLLKSTQVWVTKEATRMGDASKAAPDTFYVNTGNSGVAAYTFNTYDISDYIGKDFTGYAGFKTDSTGTTVLYALWDKHVAVTDAQLSADDQETNAGAGKFTGCNPLKP